MRTPSVEFRCESRNDVAMMLDKGTKGQIRGKHGRRAAVAECFLQKKPDEGTEGRRGKGGRRVAGKQVGRVRGDENGAPVLYLYTPC
eukprot:1176174-Prorocentrum_minimum.AAC.2